MPRGPKGEKRSADVIGNAIRVPRPQCGGKRVGLAYVWAVSTARRGYRTPPGNNYVQRMVRMWYSRKYDMSPMPHSLFFYGGYAIHGTGAIRQLGRPASHGCVRLHPANARALYPLVGSYGGARILVRT